MAISRPTAFLVAAALLTLLALPASSEAAYRWVSAELNETTQFSGDSRNCQLGRDERRFQLEGTLRRLRVHSPKTGDRIEANDRFIVGIAWVGVDGNWPDDVELVVTAVGRERHCQVGRVSWRSESVRIHVTYERLVNVPAGQPPPPAPPPPTSTPRTARQYCGIMPTRVRNIRALRTSCFQARSVARRYLLSARIFGVHRQSPFTCFDHRVTGAREVTCRASGRRWVWFRYSTTARRAG